MADLTAYERLLDRLDGVRRNGNAAMARCPAHEDRTPSLSIRPIEGQVLIYCHAGCDSRDVLAAMGMGWADLFDNPRGVDYWYDNGRVVHRGPEKTFRQSGNTNGDAQLYRLTEVKAAVAANIAVYVVEGEKDVHALESLGAVATTNPMGAANWSKVDPGPLHGGRVVVVPDIDPAGRRWVRDVLASLDGLCELLEVRAPRVGNDPADHVAAGHSLAELVPIEILLDNPADDQGTVDDPRKLFPTLDWHEIWNEEDDDEEWIVEPLIPVGRIISIYSAAKVGKSLLLQDLAAAIATGRAVLGNPANRARRVLYVDFENDPRRDIRERLKAMGYGPDDLDNLRVMSFPSLAHLDTHQGGQELLMAADAWQCDVIIIDTVSRAVGGEENDNDTWLAFYRHTGLEVKRAGLTLIRLDHTGKDERKGQRGGSAKSGDVDAVWRLTKESETLLTLTCEAHRFPLDQADLTIDRTTIPLGHTIRLDGKQQAFEAKVARIVAVLDKAQLPADAGQKACRQVLKDRGQKASNDALREAIQRRRQPAEAGGKPVEKVAETVPATLWPPESAATPRPPHDTEGETAGQEPLSVAETEPGHPSAMQPGQVAGWPPPQRGGHRPGQAANGDQDNALTDAIALIPGTVIDRERHR